LFNNILYNQRTKTRRELLRISAAVMGIEFAYAAETAFVSPLLLNIGLRHRHMTLMWCLSPLVRINMYLKLYFKCPIMTMIRLHLYALIFAIPGRIFCNSSTWLPERWMSISTWSTKALHTPLVDRHSSWINPCAKWANNR
jgi:hypothetical protein